MTLKELKTAIQSNILTPEALVLQYADDNGKYVALQYAAEIAKNHGLRTVRISSFNEIPNANLAFMLANDPELHVLDVEQFIEPVKQPQDFENLVIITNKLDKKTQALWGAYTVQIPKLTDWQVKDFISTKCPNLDPRDVDWLCTVSKGNLFRLTNELDKLLLFEPEQREELLAEFKDSIYSDLYELEIIQLATVLTETAPTKKAKLSEFMGHKHSIDIDPIALVNILLSKYKQILYFTFNSGVTAEQCGLTSRQVNGIKYYNKDFPLSEVTEMLTFLSDIDLRLKSNRLDLPKDQLLDYIICGVCSRCQR